MNVLVVEIMTQLDAIIIFANDVGKKKLEMSNYKFNLKKYE